MLNLLANAAKYGGADQPIEVAVGADAPRGVDRGARSRARASRRASRPRIFREFYRSPEAYRSGVEGTGLGLALVKRHIEALGGTRRGRVAARGGRDVHDPLAARAGADRMTRILVVEDDPSIRLGLEDTLAAKGYEVEAVGRGGEGAERATSAAATTSSCST